MSRPPSKPLFPEIPLPLDLRLQKLFKLLDIISKISKKTLNNPEITMLFFQNLKKLHSLYFICLSELVLVLNFLGLEKIASFLEKLFHSFKLQVYSLLVFHQQTMRFKDLQIFKSNNDKNSEHFWFSQDSLHVVIQLLEKLDYRHRYYLSSDINQYEKLEKAKFFLEQEMSTLEEMLRDYKNSKDEIDALLRTKRSFHNISHSGLNNFLEGFLTDTKKVAIGLNQFIEEEKKQDQKYAELIQIDFKYEEMKIGLLKKTDKRFLQKTIVTNRKSLVLNLCEQATQTVLNNEVIAITDNLENLTMENLPTSAPALRRLVTSLNFEKKEVSSKLMFANQKIETLQNKVQAFEKKIKTERENADKFKEINSDFELKIQRKRMKLRALKVENKELLGKLEHYVDKDQMNRVLILNKADDFERTTVKIAEKERNLILEISQKNDEIRSLKEKIQSLEEKLLLLEQEKNQINDLLTFEQDKNLDLQQKQPDSLSIMNNETLTNPPSSSRNRRPSFMQGGTDNSRKSKAAVSFTKNIEDFTKISTKPNKMQKNSIFRTDLGIPKVTLKTEIETPGITIMTEITSPKIKTTPIKTIPINTTPIKTSPRSYEENKTSVFFSKEMEKVMETMNKMKDSENFERNLAFLMENKEMDVEKEAENQKDLKKKIEEYEKKIEKEKEKCEKLQEKVKIIEKNRKNERKEAKKTESIEKIQSFHGNKSENERNSAYFKKKSVTIERKSITPEKKPNFLEKQNEKRFEVHPDSKEKLEKPARSSNLQKKRSSPKPKTSHLRVRTEEAPFFEKLFKTTTNEIMRKQRKIIDFKEKASKTPNNKLNLKQPGSSEEFDENYYNSCVFEPISKEKDLEIDENNYSKKKFLYKYPFKEIKAYLSLEKEKAFVNNKNSDQEFFLRIFKELSQKHENCGQNCGHLTRFYKKIPFISRYRQKERLLEQRTVIDKLPVDF